MKNNKEVNRTFYIYKICNVCVFFYFNIHIHIYYTRTPYTNLIHIYIICNSMNNKMYATIPMHHITAHHITSHLISSHLISYRFVAREYTHTHTLASHRQIDRQIGNYSLHKIYAYCVIYIIHTRTRTYVYVYIYYTVSYSVILFVNVEMYVCMSRTSYLLNSPFPNIKLFLLSYFVYPFITFDMEEDKKRNRSSTFSAHSLFSAHSQAHSLDS